MQGTRQKFIGSNDEWLYFGLIGDQTVATQKCNSKSWM